MRISSSITAILAPFQIALYAKLLPLKFRPFKAKKMQSIMNFLVSVETACSL